MIFVHQHQCAVGRIEQMELLEDAEIKLPAEWQPQFDDLPLGYALAAWDDGRFIKWIKY